MQQRQITAPIPSRLAAAQRRAAATRRPSKLTEPATPRGRTNHGKLSVEVDGRTVKSSRPRPKKLVRKVHEAGKKTKGSGNIAADLTRAALGQGVAFGFGDEIEAAVRAQFDKRTRKELLADIREDIDASAPAIRRWHMAQSLAAQ